MFKKQAQALKQRQMRSPKPSPQPKIITEPTQPAHIGNGAVQRLLIQLRNEKKPPSAIGYLGLNPQANQEAKALKRAAGDQVIVSLDDAKEQAVLQAQEGKINFIEQHLGIDFQRQMAKFLLVLECLEKCDPAFCDQMADMLELFSNAENGKYQLERLVLSGHHARGEMWGDQTDKLEPGSLLLNRDLPNLVSAFPAAAAQVQDIMFSACNSKEQVNLCTKLFPNLKSVWIYEGYSPTVKQGSAGHITQWERKTRGDHVPRRRDAKGNAVIWSSDKDFLIESGKVDRE